VKKAAKRGVVAVLVMAALAGAFLWRKRWITALAIESQRVEVVALEAELKILQRRLAELIPKEKNLLGMPKTAIRFGIPTSLTRDLVTRVTAGLVDQVTLVLEDLHVKKKVGTIKKIVELGEYDLDVTVDKVVGRLHTGKPDVQFGGNQVKVALPVTVASGTGRATIRFKWDGRSVAGAVCGDLDITREVTGVVKPDHYAVRGTLLVSSTGEQIVMSPRFPTLTINLKVVPSTESWAAVQKVLEDKDGVCGFVLGKVDILQIVRRIVDKGFDVRLPTEKLKAMAVPVGIEPSVMIRGRPLTLGLRVGGFAITENAIWLGADVDLVSRPVSGP
jgi:hypothetical protein